MSLEGDTTSLNQSTGAKNTALETYASHPHRPLGGGRPKL